MVMPKKKAAGVDKFIEGAKASQADNEKKKTPPVNKPKYLLNFPNEDLRNALHIEALSKRDQFKNLSEYICAILEKRDQVKL